MESLLRNTDSTSITTMYLEYGPTYFSPQGTSRTLDRWVGPVGIHHIVEECRVLWKTGRRLQIIPAGLPRDHMPIPYRTCATRYSLREQRRRHMLETSGTCKRLQAVSREVTNEWNICRQLKTHSSKLIQKFEAIREDPTTRRTLGTVA